jgi:ABC-type multidrug transport system fused ATPase/permease subunit
MSTGQVKDLLSFVKLLLSTGLPLLDEFALVNRMLSLYSPDAIALRTVSLKILPGHKLGICGRTGRYVETPNPPK